MKKDRVYKCIWGKDERLYVNVRDNGVVEILSQSSGNFSTCLNRHQVRELRKQLKGALNG